MMGERIWRWRWAVLGGALLLLALAVAFWPQPVPVDTAPVTRGPMSVGVIDDGVTRAEDLYVVSAPVTGYLSRVELEPGDRVERGALIASMSGRPSTPLDLRARRETLGELAAARAAERGAQANLAQARRDLARAEELGRSGFLSRAQLEAARTRAVDGEATLQQSRGDVRRVQAVLATPSGAASGRRVPVRAPAGGLVLSVVNESEGVIAEGAPVMAIGDPRRIELVIDLLSREAVRVRPGNRVEITQWGGDEPLLGHVKEVEPFGQLKISALGIEEQRVNVIVGFSEAMARKASRLGHGYQIDARIILWSAAHALRVPIGALFRGPGGGWRAFALRQGRAAERRLKIGHINDEYAEVLGGLVVGDRVLLNPGSMIEDGTRVVER